MASASNKGFTTVHCNKELFQQILQKIDENAILESWHAFQKNTESGYSSNLSLKGQKEVKQLIGVSFFNLEYTISGKDGINRKAIAIKSKIPGSEVIKAYTSLFPGTGFREPFNEILVNLGVSLSHQRELQIVSTDDETICAVMPEHYWSWINDNKEIYVFAMEYFDPNLFSHIDTVNDINAWKQEDILSTLKDLSLFHGKFYGNVSNIPANIKKYLKEIYFDEFVPSLRAVLEHNKKTTPLFWDDGLGSLGDTILDNASAICDILRDCEKTFAHGNFLPQNVCLRQERKANKTKLCLYDWEYCFIGPPQYDLAMFLSHTMPKNSDVSLWHFYVEKYMGYLKENTSNNLYFDYTQFLKIFDMCVCDQFINLGNWGYALIVPLYNPPFADWYYNNLVQYARYAVEKYCFKKTIKH